MTHKTPKDERDLDRAIEKTFPASDPVAPKHITGTEPVGSDPMRKPPKIRREQVEGATPDTEICQRCNGEGTLSTAETEGAPTKPCPDCVGLGRVVAAGKPDPR